MTGGTGNTTTQSTPKPAPKVESEQSEEEKAVEAAKAEIELEYRIEEGNEEEGIDPDPDTVVDLKNIYKTLALELVQKLPEGRLRFLALNELSDSKAWAVEATKGA